MDYAVRALTVEDGAIVWEMLRYAAHKPSLESAQKQPSLARYASGWGRVGDFGCVAESNTVAMGAAWLRLWEEEKGFGHVSDAIPELAIAVLPDYRGQGIGTQLHNAGFRSGEGSLWCGESQCSGRQSCGEIV